MAAFEQHINFSVLLTGTVIVPLHSSGFLDTNQSIIVLILGIVGGMLPDLDSSNSKPVQIVFKILSIFLPLMILFSIPENLSILAIIAIWFFSSLLLHLTLFKIFLTLTSHRGIFHSIPMGLLFAELTTLLFYKVLYVDATFSITAGAFLFFGFILHLLLDELFSINALGLSIKKSFGSALKLYDKNNIIGTIILYALVASLYSIIPVQNDIFINVFNVFKNTALY